MPGEYPPFDYAVFLERMGLEPLRERLLKEAYQESEEIRQSMEWLQRFHTAIEYFFRFTGLYGRGYRNALNIQVFENDLQIQNLPEALQGFKILQLSDLHIDVDPQLSPRIVQALQGLEYDLAVITGDFRCRTITDYYPAIEATRPIIEALKAPTYAILGNHDPLALVPILESFGVKFLINEWVEIKHKNISFALAGIDDPHFYQTGDLKILKAKIPENLMTILLSHSPEMAEEAAILSYDSLLAGHTHGGQICLPNGYPLSTNLKDKSNRFLVSGKWEVLHMQGYTSRGTGCCGAPLRFNCPAEITLHTLIIK